MYMNNILTRRTIRKYSTKDVDNELLRDLLTKASRTQTMGNMQLYSVVVTRSEEGTGTLQPTDGDTGAGGAYCLRRLQKGHRLVYAQEG